MLSCRKVGLVVVAILVAAGCGSKTKLEVGASCLLNSDCNSPLVCTMGKCHEGCRVTTDCPAGQSCVKVSGVGVCQLPVEVQCSATMPCGPLLICASDLRCRTTCTSAAECTPGQVCVQDVCADSTDLDVNGHLPQKAPAAVDAGGTDAGADFSPDVATPDVPINRDAPDTAGGAAPDVLPVGGVDGGRIDVAADLSQDVGIPDAPAAPDGPAAGTCVDAGTTIGAVGMCCPQNGALGCSTHASADQVMCVNGIWTSNGTCPQGQLCDTRPGFTAGSCQNVVAECSGKNPGDNVCSGQTVETCGPDLISATEEQVCTNQACVNGVCQGACEPGQKTCIDNTPQICSETGLAQAQTPCGGATPVCSAGECVPAASMTMALLPLGYRIDSTEVTQGQYQTWLDTTPSPAGQISVCGWNASFIPSCHWTPVSTPDDPVVCVDWCDAYAYCAAVGKRLCGKIGGGPNDYADYADATRSQWYAACTSNGRFVSYPYGDTYSGTACNGADAAIGAMVEVGTMSGCQSPVTGYSGVYDLLGNVAEWEDSCTGTAGQPDTCYVRGGSFANLSTFMTCDYANPYYPRSQADGYVGFRCCSP